MKKLKTPKETLFKDCGTLWAKCVKARANWKSEFSGKTGELHAHHISGKTSYLLRFSLDNGICVTAGEHFFGLHNQGRKDIYEDKIKSLRGDDIFQKLKTMKMVNQKTDLWAVKFYLESKLKEFEERNKRSNI